MDASMEEWPTASETTIVYLQMMYKTPIFAEPQQCNRTFPTGQLSAFIIQLEKFCCIDFVDKLS
jgi:hypothetical protein